uniref:Putative ovule protein n=1 Tax=Solanum chacoense TaxID=4108 RepID=A0A0V0GQ51_SOLCH
MHGITEVTEEFYGSLSSKKPFNSLVELRFEDMPEWKQWHVLGSGEFPTLEKLKLKIALNSVWRHPSNFQL